MSQVRQDMNLNLIRLDKQETNFIYILNQFYYNSTSQRHTSKIYIDQGKRKQEWKLSYTPYWNEINIMEDTSKFYLNISK